MVEEIQEVAANFELSILRKFEALHQAQVRIGISGTSEGVSSEMFLQLAWSFSGR